MFYLFARALAVAAIVWLGFRLYRTWMSRPSESKMHDSRPNEFERMKPCSECEVHVPVSALNSAGRCKKCR
tara:strand:+ start:1481 stop:1693 length:213 start_codon:yes stop_codon:yes gene_type:complete